MKKSFLYVVLFLPFCTFCQVDALGLDVPEASTNNALNIFFAALAGCIVQEVIYWFELRHEIAKGNIPDALNSKPYWAITIISIIIFSTVTFFYFKNLDSVSNNYFTIGTFAAGFPRLFKSAVSKVKIPPKEESTDKENKNPSAKSENTGKFGLREYLML